DARLTDGGWAAPPDGNAARVHARRPPCSIDRPEAGFFCTGLGRGQLRAASTALRPGNAARAFPPRHACSISDRPGDPDGRAPTLRDARSARPTDAVVNAVTETKPWPFTIRHRIVGAWALRI